jgi:hypothetical protein
MDKPDKTKSRRVAKPGIDARFRLAKKNTAPMKSLPMLPA